MKIIDRSSNLIVNWGDFVKGRAEKNSVKMNEKQAIDAARLSKLKIKEENETRLKSKHTGKRQASA
jgi:hypothetical protein